MSNTNVKTLLQQLKDCDNAITTKSLRELGFKEVRIENNGTLYKNSMGVALYADFYGYVYAKVDDYIPIEMSFSNFKKLVDFMECNL